MGRPAGQAAQKEARPKEGPRCIPERAAAGGQAGGLGRWGVAERCGGATQGPAVNTPEGQVGPGGAPGDLRVRARGVGSPGSAGESQSKPRRRYQRCPGATWDGRPGVEDGVSGGRQKRIRREGPRGGAPASADAFPSWACLTNSGHWRCLAGCEGQSPTRRKGDKTPTRLRLIG